MSVAMTANAVIERRKTVTRRKGWWLDKNGRRLLNVGDTLTLCRKVQGRKAGEPLVRLVDVEVLDVRREPLGLLLGEPGGTALEGFPDMTGVDFINRFFVDAQGIDPDELVTRIEWRYLVDDAPCQPCADNLRCDDCHERMCEVNGPEPRPCGTTCAECPCSCQGCLDARADRVADTLRHIERDAEWWAEA